MGKAKILLIDIENTPLVSYTWGRYEQNVVDVTQESYILSFAYKWLKDSKTHVIALDDYIGNKSNTNDSIKFIQDIHKIMSEADIIIGQNSDAFDLKHINTRFIYYGLSPIPPHKSIDTLKVARKYFKFSSNKLNDLGKRLGLGEKVETGGFKLWLGCMQGDSKSWKLMKNYNKNDVILLEKVYLKLLPWIRNHPVIGLYTNGGKCCANCGSKSLQSRGLSRNKTTVYRRFFCNSCGSWGRDTENIQTNKVLVSA